MSQTLSLAQSRAVGLASTLMVPVTLFRINEDDFGVMPSNELDGDDDLDILHEYDPWEGGWAH